MATVRDRWVAPVRPNGLHGAPEGLWLMAQSGDGVTDTNVYLLRYEDGSVIRKVHTGLHRAGGLTIGGGAIWVTSERELTKLDLEGNILKQVQAPGGRGAHGLHWVDEHSLWVSDPLNYYVHLVDPASWRIRRSVPYPANRKGHGLFVREGTLWQGVRLHETGGGEIFQLDPHDGTILHHMAIPAPEVHGMTCHQQDIWFCCAVSHRVCTVPLPA